VCYVPTMTITREDVRRVAELARLELSADEEGRLVGELDAILGYVAKLAGLDVSEVPPTANALDVGGAFREDEVTNAPDAEHLLANAPDRWQSFFRVPKIIE
jgi:aspartyl-tRNA(Asn)/glutamyl-tRNA(Gln) amidotransferase subunit C